MTDKMLEISATEAYDNKSQSEYSQIRLKFASGWTDATPYFLRRLVLCWNALDGIPSDQLEPPGENCVSGLQLIMQQRDIAWAELRAIREAINASPGESTLDEVRRLVSRADTLGNAERVWEKSMMAAIGEDGPLSVAEAIGNLKQKIDILKESNKRLGERVICGRETIPIKARRPGATTAQLQAALSAVTDQRDRLLAIVDQYVEGLRAEAQAAVAGVRIPATNQEGGSVNYSVAIVEKEDGQIATVPPHMIRFDDKEGTDHDL